jgi:hypothetical protein
MTDITKALMSLRPEAEWVLDGDRYEGLRWLDTTQSCPSQADVNAEVLRLQAEWNSKEYQRLRRSEYPPVTDYLDAVVKGDLAGQQAYIDACQAVKAKYPKPEGV